MPTKREGYRRGRPGVIVLDNYPVSHGQLVQEAMPAREAAGVRFFLLPPYGPGNERHGTVLAQGAVAPIRLCKTGPPYYRALIFYTLFVLARLAVVLARGKAGPRAWAAILEGGRMALVWPWFVHTFAGAPPCQHPPAAGRK